ncbi:bacteriocin immunity protein [Streptococcus cameli]
MRHISRKSRTKDDQIAKEQLFNALLDPQVAQDADLYKMCLAAKKELENGDPENLVYARLNKSLSFYLLSHEYTAPQSVLDLLQTIGKSEQVYRSQAGLANLLGNLFRGH